MKLSHYAKKLGLHYRTAWNMFNKGQIPRAFKLPSGTIIVPEEFKNNLCGVSNKVIIYGRVSSHKQKNDLEAQVQRLTNYAISKGYQIVKIFKEVASEFNDNRRELNIILEKDCFDILLVENKDRLTRIGFNFLDKYLQRKNQRIEVANMAQNKDDLMQDLISIITSYCAKYYGQRGYLNKKKEILKVLDIEE